MADPVTKSTSQDSLYAEPGAAEPTTGKGSVATASGASCHHGGEPVFDQKIKDLFDRSVAQKPSAWSWLELSGTAALSVGGFVFAPAIVGAGLAGLTVKKGFDIWSDWSASKSSEQLRQELLNWEGADVLSAVRASGPISENSDSWVESQCEKVSLLQDGVKNEESLAPGKLSPDIQSPGSPLNPVLHIDIHSSLFMPNQGVEREVSPGNADNRKPDQSEVVVEQSPVSGQGYIDGLEKQVGKLQKDVGTLRQERDRLLSVLEDAGQALDHSDAKDKERLEISKYLDADMQELRNQNDALQGSVKDYTNQLQAKTESANSLKVELVEKEKQLNVLQAEYNQVKKELDELRREAEKSVEGVDSRVQNNNHGQQREVERIKNLLGTIVNLGDQPLKDDDLKEIGNQLELNKNQSENWEKLCEGIGAPGIDLQNLVDNWRHQADAAQKWHETIDPLRAAGLDMTDEKFLNLVQKVVIAQKNAK